MALKITVDGTVHTPMPGNQAPLQIGAHATLEGTLATAAAQLQLQARLRPETGTTDTALQADVQAAVAPGRRSPLQSATATLRALDLAALWPQAPPRSCRAPCRQAPRPARPEAPAGWALGVQLQNTLPGPWDTARLPLTALQAKATYDGTRWTLPGATASVGRAAASHCQGRYTPPPARWRARRSCASSARRCTPRWRRPVGPGQCAHRTVRWFSARTSAPLTPARPELLAGPRSPAAHPPPHHPRPMADRARHIHRPKRRPGRCTSSACCSTRCTPGWRRPTCVSTPHPVRPGPAGPGSAGATARASGQLAPLRGQGELQVQWADVARTQAWLVGLPWIGADLQRRCKAHLPRAQRSSPPAGPEAGATWRPSPAPHRHPARTTPCCKPA